MHEVQEMGKQPTSSWKHSQQKDETPFEFHTLLSDNLNGKLYNPFASSINSALALLQ